LLRMDVSPSAGTRVRGGRSGEGRCGRRPRPGCARRVRVARVSRPGDGLSPYRQRRGLRSTDRRDLLNALPHRSGVEINAGGRTLRFHLAGINNQNFIMRDEETGSWWQQVTGCAFLGPLKGRCLESISWDEVTFAVFRAEHPGGVVLLPAAGV